jgi:hypothetical protein
MASTMTPEFLRQLAEKTDSASIACKCAPQLSRGWISVPLSFPETDMVDMGAVIEGDDIDVNGLTVDEFHPNRTNYWSEDAPIAAAYFPYNRCRVQQCRVCERSYLRYTEFGGYYVEPRVRLLSASLLA